jgi:hypothetical protein
MGFRYAGDMAGGLPGRFNNETRLLTRVRNQGS